MEMGPLSCTLILVPAVHIGAKRQALPWSAQDLTQTQRVIAVAGSTPCRPFVFLIITKINTYKTKLAFELKKELKLYQTN